MDASNLSHEMKNKERSFEDLARYIENRIEKNPNYALLLGSGCSVTSGIPSGFQLIQKWREEIFSELTGGEMVYSEEVAKKHLKENESSWYSENNEYSSLFEKKYDFPSQRRRFIEGLVADKQPSIGYAYLVNLVKDNYFNAIFTTNFDDLINEAFYHYSDKRPMLCAQDSSVSSLNLTSSRPKIVKLHGDYLFEDIKSSLRETESLENNIKGKLIEFCKDHGLIVVGYAGNDRSIIDVINYLLRSDSHLSNGLYWCLRRTDKVSDEVKKLLWKDKVYYVYIDGFDEFFAELNSKIIQKFPIEESLISNKTSKMIESYISNKYLECTVSQIIKDDVKRLVSQKARNNVSKFIQEFTELDKNRNLSDLDFEMVMKLQILIKNRDYKKAVEVGEQELKLKSGSTGSATIYRYVAQAYKSLKQKDKAIECYEKLLDLDVNNPIPLIEKSKLLKRLDDRESALNSAIEVDPDYHDSYDEKAIIFIEKFESLEMNKRKDCSVEIVRNLHKSLELWPDHKNPSWVRLFEFIISNDFLKEQKSDLGSLLGNLSRQGQFRLNFIRMKSKFILKYEDEKDKDEFYSKLTQHIDRVPKAGRLRFKVMMLEVASRFSKKEEVRTLTFEIINEMSQLEQKDPGFMVSVAEALAEKLGEFEEAVRILKEAKELEDRADIIAPLVSYLLIQDFGEEAEKLLNDNIDLFSDRAYTEHAMMLSDSLGKSQDALNFARRNVADNGLEDQMATYVSYYLIKHGDISTAYNLLREFLEPLSFSRTFTAEIVNYELCKMRQSKKVDKVRLNEALNYTGSLLSKAAVYELTGEREKALEKIREALQEDATEILGLRNWPVFEDIRNTNQVSALIR